jgi:glycogen operon protein
VKNFLVADMLALGVPMILMGDEVRRTQGGNNNAYCRDDETGWLDWRLLDRHPGTHRFLKALTARRALRSDEPERRRLSLNDILRRGQFEWHGVKLGQPDWSPRGHAVALAAEVRKYGLLIHVIFNAYWEPLEFELPPLPAGRWRRWIDTSLASPEDIVELEEAPEIDGAAYRAEARSVVLLFARQAPPPAGSDPDADRGPAERPEDRVNS